MSVALIPRGRTAVRDRWRELVDESYPAQQSLMLRYHRALKYGSIDGASLLDQLLAVGIREGAQVVRLGERRGVEIVLCDESSLMHTGTFKALDACLITALVKHDGGSDVVLSSGGNLGCALAAYGRRSDIRVHLFHPSSTAYKIRGPYFDHTVLVAADMQEKSVKQLALDFAKHYGMTHVPSESWRLAAAGVRALHVIEAASELGRFDAMAQTICAGYGPVGVYQVFKGLLEDGLIDAGRVPMFLGFQQEANAPMVRAWSEGSREIVDDRAASPSNAAYLEPVLYNTNPGFNYTRLFDAMRAFSGDLLSVSADDYERYEDDVLGLFDAVGYRFTRDEAGRILEKTGLITGVGILKAIDAGRLEPGQRVLYMLTGGFRELASRPADCRRLYVDDSMRLEELVEHLGEQLDLSRADVLVGTP